MSNEDLIAEARKHVGAHVPEHSSEGVRASTAFSIDRQLWGVAYRGSELTSDLVDNDMYLDVRLVARE